MIALGKEAIGMAVEKQNQKYSVKITYDSDWDDSGGLGYDNYTQTFGKLKENSTIDQLHAFAVAMMSLTIYHNAPYKISFIDNSELVIE